MQNVVAAEYTGRPLAVTVEATKKLTSLGNTTIWALIKEGRLKTAMVGRRRLVLVDSIEALLRPAE
jgi:excisionase family DNA binding protein